MTGGQARGKTRPFRFRTRTTQQSAPWPNCNNNRATAAVLCPVGDLHASDDTTATSTDSAGEAVRRRTEAQHQRSEGSGQMRTPAECNTQRHRQQQQQQRPQKKRKEDRKRRRRAEEHFLRSRRGGIQRGARSELRCVMDHIIGGWGWRPPRPQSS